MAALDAPNLADLINLEGAFGAYDAGYAGWTCQAEVASSTYQTATGVAVYTAFRPATPGPSTNVYTVTSTAGATLTANQSLVGLYSLSGSTLTQVAVSADNSVVWAATAGLKNVALASGTLLEDTIYYLGLLCVGTTQPIFRATGANAGLNGIATNPQAFTLGSGLTTLPATAAIGSGTAITQKIHIAIG